MRLMIRCELMDYAYLRNIEDDIPIKLRQHCQVFLSTMSAHRVLIGPHQHSPSLTAITEIRTLLIYFVFAYEAVTLGDTSKPDRAGLSAGQRLQISNFKGGHHRILFDTYIGAVKCHLPHDRPFHVIQAQSLISTPATSR